MGLSLKIARKYLFSKKNHSVINILSAVSAAAIGVGCAALIIILSVFNGFNTLVTKMYSEGAPDFVVEPASGKVISLSDSSIANLITICDTATFRTDEIDKLCPDSLENPFVFSIDGVDFFEYDILFPSSTPGIRPVLLIEDNAYIQINGTQRVGKVIGKGDDDYALVSESFIPQPNESDSITIYVPTRTGDISLLAPTESIWQESLPVRVSELKGQSLKNEECVYIPLKVAQNLFEYSEDEVNRIELPFSTEICDGYYIPKSLVNDNSNFTAYIGGKVYKSKGKAQLFKKLKSLFKEMLGDKYVVKDFYEQNATIYKMIRSEKLAVYLILFFVIIIIGVNIISSVAIMILEKQGDIQTLRTMGADGSLLRRAFTLHGALICMVGAVAGLVTGLIICWLQQRYGFISLPGNFITNAYPVTVKLSDVLIILAGILAICFSLSYIPSRFIKSGR